MNKARADVVLVVGSGIHKFPNEAASGPLSGWWNLLDTVARELQVELKREHPPSIAWEQMLLDMAATSAGRNNSLSINAIEKTVRKTTSQIIRKCAEVGQNEDGPTVINSPAVGEFITLNFEASWFIGNIPDQNAQIRGMERLLRTSASATAETLRLYGHLAAEGSFRRRIWFPNGHWAQPKSLRMGYRDFGLQPAALAQAFKVFKAWERRVLGRKGSDSEGRPKTHAQWVTLLDAWDSENLNSKYSPVRTWVAAFMLRTPVFVGTGLSSYEQGLWWLLCQRARNVARLDNVRPPLVLKKLHKDDSGKVCKIWSKPFGLEVLWCENWNNGWRVLNNKLSSGGP